MKSSSALRAAVALLACVLAAAAGLAAEAGAGSSGATTAAKSVAGTVETRVVLHNFTASGTRIVGHGTVVSTLRNAAGATRSTATHPFRVLLQSTAGPGPCQILYLELDDLDLTLLGLRVHLQSATAGEPIKLTLSADSTHGVLGKLFCNLAGATISTPTTAATAAQSLTKKTRDTTLLHATATLYQPSRTTSGVKSFSSAQGNCSVLHLILGPLHLDLLGLIVDLNKVVLDLEAIPGTTFGNLFCSLVGGSTTTGTTTTATTTTTPATTTTG
jgi:hypothetical protein